MFKLTQLLLVCCALIALLASSRFIEAKLQQTCPCTTIQGPASICPNTAQNLFVLNAPAGSTVTFSVPLGSTGNIVSQTGTSAVINQPGGYLATVCFPLSITIPTGTNCVNCNNPLVTASLSSNIAGNPSTITICQTGTNPSSVVLTCNTNIPVNPATTTYRFFSNGVLVADTPSNTLTVNLSSFVGNAAAYTCRAVTQSTQCVSAPSNTITIIRCTGGGTCPTAVTITLQGQCPSLSIRAVISNPQPGVTYTFTLRRSVAVGGPYVAISSLIVGPFAVVPVGGIFAVFGNLPAGAAFFRVDVTVANCPVISSNILTIPACCTPVGAVLSSNQPGNPSSLTICTTPPGPSTIVLTCNANAPVPAGTTYRFVRNGVVVAQTASNTLSISISQFTAITLANFYCQVITQPGACVGPQSNVITVQRCAGANLCPTGVTLTALGSCPSLSLRAVVINQQLGVTYTFTLRRATAIGGPYVAISSQVIGPFPVTLPIAGISAVFSNLPVGNAFYIVDVSVAGCPVVSSNIINLPNCGCVISGAILSSNQPGNPSALTICTTPPGPSTIVLTCTATSSGVSGASYRFLRNGVIVQQSTSNTLTVTFAQFSTIAIAAYQCQVVTQPGPCIGPLSNTINIQRCAGGGGCPTAVNISFVGSCPSINIRAVISNPQPGIAYTFTLRRSTAVGGPYLATNSQVVGPFAVVPPGGIVAIFSGFPLSSAFFFVDVAVPGCPVISSNILSFGGCLITPLDS